MGGEKEFTGMNGERKTELKKKAAKAMEREKK
jgi:hypothetical protein